MDEAAQQWLRAYSPSFRHTYCCGWGTLSRLDDYSPGGHWQCGTGHSGALEQAGGQTRE